MGPALQKTVRKTMRAVALDRFGGIEEMQVRTLPVPEVGPD